MKTGSCPAFPAPLPCPNGETARGAKAPRAVCLYLLFYVSAPGASCNAPSGSPFPPYLSFPGCSHPAVCLPALYPVVSAFRQSPPFPVMSYRGTPLSQTIKKPPVKTGGLNPLLSVTADALHVWLPGKRPPNEKAETCQTRSRSHRLPNPYLPCSASSLALTLGYWFKSVWG